MTKQVFIEKWKWAMTFAPCTQEEYEADLEQFATSREQEAFEAGRERKANYEGIGIRLVHKYKTFKDWKGDTK